STGLRASGSCSSRTWGVGAVTSTRSRLRTPNSTARSLLLRQNRRATGGKISTTRVSVEYGSVAPNTPLPEYALLATNVEYFSLRTSKITDSSDECSGLLSIRTLHLI